MLITRITVTYSATVQVQQYEPLKVEMTMEAELSPGEDPPSVAALLYLEARRAVRDSLKQNDNPRTDNWLSKTMYRPLPSESDTE